VFLPFLEKEFPALAASYRERYKDRAFLPKAYGKRLSQLMARLREKYGIHNQYDRYNRHERVAVDDHSQLALF